MHLFEVYANQECTERPQVGQSYERLYVKVNADLTTGYSYVYGDSTAAYTCLDVRLERGEAQEISLFIDYISEELQAPPVAGQVIECITGIVFTIREPLQVSFGPVAPFVHQVEIFADEECTERPVTGQTYSSLYASLHGVAEDEEMSEGESPNTFVISQGSSINLEYAGYWRKYISRDSEIIMNQVHQLDNDTLNPGLTADVFSFGKIVADE